MGDAGEGLVDVEARLQEQIEELQQERRRRATGRVEDPARVRALESLRLARAELAQQLEHTAHEVRKHQLGLALEDIDRRIASL